MRAAATVDKENIHYRTDAATRTLDDNLWPAGTFKLASTGIIDLGGRDVIPIADQLTPSTVIQAETGGNYADPFYSKEHAYVEDFDRKFAGVQDTEPAMGDAYNHNAVFVAYDDGVSV